MPLDISGEKSNNCDGCQMDGPFPKVMQDSRNDRKVDIPCDFQCLAKCCSWPLLPIRISWHEGLLTMSLPEPYVTNAKFIGLVEERIARL